MDWVDPLEEGDPRQIGPYRLRGRLGKGGMGVVYLGESPGGRKVAIKVIQPDLAQDPEFRRRFAREVRAAREVGGFHTAQVVAANTDANPPWMATAYIRGPSLAQVIAEQGPRSEADVLKLGAALAEGLAEIHAKGIIHRDLKPGNVILAEDDEPRIIDFGIAKSAGADSLGRSTDASLTTPHTIIGTLHYMSPEQLNGDKNLTDRSDIFALGAVLVYAATGHDPFNGFTNTEVGEQIRRGAADLGPLTGNLRGVITACLNTDPKKRPSAKELLDFNFPAAAGEPATNGASGPVTRADPYVQPLQALAGGSPRAAVGEFPVTSTMYVAPRTPPQPGPSGAPPSPTALRQAREPRQRRWLVPLAAAGTVAVVGLAGLGGVLLLHKHPANGSSANVASVTGVLAATLSPAGSVAWSVAFGPDSTLASGDSNGNTYLWNAATRKHTSTLTSPADQAGVFSVAFGPDGIIATGEDHRRTDLWNAATGRHVATLSDDSDPAAPDQVVPSVAFGPDGIIATDQVGTTDLWNATGKLIARLPDPPGSAGVFSLAFGPTGTLAVGDHNGRVYLWNTTTRKISTTLTDPASKGVGSVAYAPDGTLATGDSNGSTYLWNTATRKVTATLTDPASSGVASVAFASNGTVLAAGDSNGSTYLWNITDHAS